MKLKYIFILCLAAVIPLFTGTVEASETITNIASLTAATPLVIVNSNKAKVYEKLVGLVTARGLPKAAIQDRQMLIHQKIVSNRVTYTFNINEVNQSGIDQDIRLIPSDAFCITSIGLWLKKATTTSSVDQLGAAQWYSYPDKTVFNEATSGQAEFLSLLNVYNGQLSMNEDQVEVFSKLNTAMFMAAPETQDAAATVAGATTVVDLFKNPLLGGNRQNQAILQIGNSTADNITGAAGEENYIGLILDGFVIRGGAESVTFANL